MPVERTRLDDGWDLAWTSPGECPDAAAAVELDWRPAPCAVGGGLTAAGSLDDGYGATGRDYDAEDWWFRTRPAAAGAQAGENLVLELGGLATLAQVWVDGECVLESESMFAAHQLDVPGGVGELVICCRALRPRLAERRRPRARWRTKLVEGNLRFVRTMLLGRAPGFAAGPAVVGPWRGAELVRRRGLVAEGVMLRPRMRGETGVLAVSGRLRGGHLPEAVSVTVAEAIGTLAIDADGNFAGEVTVPAVQLWWPHTHGTPVMYPVVIDAGDEVIHRGRTGFRTLEHAADMVVDGPALRVNGVAIHCRGAVWAPLSLADPHGCEDALRPVLSTAAGAGLNMLRIPGTACYESDAFHDLCDELGILVWQDLMFANLDYPESDPDFLAVIETEVGAELARLAGRPSLAVVCGGSEVAQQVAMLGLDPALADGPLYGELLPRLVAEARVDAAYIPSSPWGGELPFRPGAGVAHYFGVGAYRRSLEDARRSEVRFATECLAFANVPDEDALPTGAVYDRTWKAGVPRDAGASWDFDDVRDHYLRELYGEDPVGLRSDDPERFLELSRQVSGEVMAETLGEWRRAESPCSGALVLWLKDLAPGAGWGLLDHRGTPKAALGHLRRVLAPVAVWTTDEGLSGIAVHVANDAPAPLSACLRLALYRDATRVEETTTKIRLDGHQACRLDAEGVLGRFADVSWAYRFGPPVADVVAVTLEDEDGGLRSQAFRFPAGRPLRPRPAAELGLRTEVQPEGADRMRVIIETDRLLYGTRIEVPGWRADDDAFCVEPGHPRLVGLQRTGHQAKFRGALRALNLSGFAQI